MWKEKQENPIKWTCCNSLVPYLISVRFRAIGTLPIPFSCRSKMHYLFVYNYIKNELLRKWNVDDMKTK